MNELVDPPQSEQSQSGAVAVIVAVFVAAVAIVMLAFATDIGSLWQSQRALVTDTDAAALAGAIELAEDWMENGGECGDLAAARAEAESVLALNNAEGEATNTDIAPDADCERDPASAGDFSGWVEMSASQPSPGFVSGRDDLAAGGTSTAEFLLGVSDFEQGLAICEELFAGTEILNSKFELLNGNLAIPYTKATQTLVGQGGTACGISDEWETGGSPANSTKGGWGWLDGVCGPVLPGGSWCSVDTGTDDLQRVLGPVVGEEVRFPIFDAWDGDSGTNADLRIVGLMTATVESTCRISGGGNDPADPQACNISSNLSNRFNGQPDFIIVSGEPYLFDDPRPQMFDEAEYSICDVQGDREFCRSTG